MIEGHVSDPLRSLLEFESEKLGFPISYLRSNLELDNTGYSLTVNGLGAGAGTSLSDHDILCMVPKVEGGIR